MDTDAERRRLTEISEWYSNANWGFYTTLVRMGFDSIAPHFVDGSCLEIGCADGEMTRFLAQEFQDLAVIDAAESYVAASMRVSDSITGYVSLVEEWSPPRRFDNVILAHVLEHVVDPLATLRKLATIVTDSGRLHVIVPNARSLHRLAGVKMGLLESPSDLNEADLSVGHRRVYSSATLRRDLVDSGFQIVASGGIFLKPLSNAQIESSWSDELITAYYALGKEFPDNCGELFAVCTPAR